MRASVRVWDIPTRLFHWLLVVLLALSWWSAENREMEWHLWSGISLLGLLAFRVLWGIIGGSTARFRTFLRSPAAVTGYLKGKGPKSPGHNPLGGYSVIAMLALLAIQIATGLFATDIDGLESGPLSFLVTFEQSRASAELHEIAFNLLVAVIALHVLAILFYLVIRRRNLLLPMLTGKDDGLDAANGELTPARAWKFPLAATAAAAFAWWTWTGFGL